MPSSSSSTGISSPSRRNRAMQMERGDERRCHCGAQVVLWTSWTDSNPGRRFYGCPNYSPAQERIPKKGCDYFTWYDGEICMRAKEVINSLKNERKSLKEEKKHLLRRIQLDAIGMSLEDIDAIAADGGMSKLNREDLKENYYMEVEKMKKGLRAAHVSIIWS